MIYLNSVSKRFGPKVILDDVSFHLRPKEKVGLVGANGTGKTTLFRIVLGEESVDAGTVTIRKGARLAKLSQELENEDGSILDRVVLGDPQYRSAKTGMEALEADQELHQRDPEEWSRRYGNLQHDFERLGGYERESRGGEILTGLGFHADQLTQPLSSFSGGKRMRVELARLLLQAPDVLLLDEPTNHLDLKSVVWLEGFLRNYENTLLLISHDRRFLNALVTRTVELDRGALTVYAGNYDDYERLKAEREEQLQAAAANQQRRVAEIERFIERFRAKNTKATQVQSRIKALEKMERIETATQDKSVNFRFPQPPRAGKIVMDLESISKRYGDLRVYDNFSIKLERGWKVALVGENGAGKSTLLKLMAGVLKPDTGSITPGHNVTLAYYGQHHTENLDPALTVLESIQQTGGHLTLTQQRTLLGAFLFSGTDVDKKVGVLSGGERSRLSLARMLVAPSSFLLLDEPTNHLDMWSCEILAAALADFEGALCTISHDRYFLDGIINRVWEVDDGTVREYVGNYSEYERVKAEEAEALGETSQTPASGDSPNRSQKDRDRKRQEAELRNQRYKQLKPLQNKIQKVEEKMETLLQEKQTLEGKLADHAIYQDDQKQTLLDTLEKKRELEKEESHLLEEWEQLTSEIETLQSPGAS